MNNNTLIALVESDDDLLDIVPLKQADDIECLGEVISIDLALEKILKMRGEGSDFWIAKQDEQTIGYAVGIVDGECYRSKGIYVSPLFRNKGVGSSLKQAQIDFARELGCRDIWSNVYYVNKPIIRVHEKLDFKFEPSGSGYITRLQLQE